MPGVPGVLGAMRLSFNQAPSELDANGWSPLHHACDATTYSERAMHAARSLIASTPVEMLSHQVTGRIALGYTCLHFACDGCDKSIKRLELATELVMAKAQLEIKDNKDNTPLSLASGAGLGEHQTMLLNNGANPNVRNYNGKGTWQKAKDVSSSSAAKLLRRGAEKTFSTKSGRQRSTFGANRSLRCIEASLHSGMDFRRPKREHVAGNDGWHDDGRRQHGWNRQSGDSYSGYSYSDSDTRAH